MLTDIGYHRERTIEYAQKWALKRNPNYLNFDGIGGDCTNFASQCLFAGCHTMNHTPTFGWYYYSPADRSPSWTSVEYFYKFLTSNRSEGPYAAECEKNELKIGDFIQLGDIENHYYHTLIVTQLDRQIYVCAHTFDAFQKPLAAYSYENIRYLHILGNRANF
jgi:hypothetical protein